MAIKSWFKITEELSGQLKFSLKAVGILNLYYVQLCSAMKTSVFTLKQKYPKNIIGKAGSGQLATPHPGQP